MSETQFIRRAHSLAGRARRAAMVLGKGDSFKIFHLDHDYTRGEVPDGFSIVGLVALTAKGLEMELAGPKERHEQNERLLLAARSEFLSALGDGPAMVN